MCFALCLQADYTAYYFLIKLCVVIFVIYLFFMCGPGSSVGRMTDYGLDSPGSNPGGDEIFCLSRPALGPI